MVSSTRQVWSLVAAVLLLGNITFGPRNSPINSPRASPGPKGADKAWGEACEPVSEAPVSHVAELLGVTRGELTEALCERRLHVHRLASPNKVSCRCGRPSCCAAPVVVVDRLAPSQVIMRPQAAKEAATTRDALAKGAQTYS